MPDFKQIIVGAGTSAYTFLYYAYIGAGSDRGRRFDPRGGKVLIVGESDLWRNIEKGDKDHKAGQPAHILALPHRRPPAVSKDKFMPVSDLVRKQTALARAAKAGVDVTVLHGKVLKVINKGRRLYGVKTTSTKGGEKWFTAEQVIIATNGPQQKPDTRVLPSHPHDTDKPYQRVIDAVTYMNNLQPPVPVVCVHGSAATSAWAVSRAIASGVKKILWVARTGFIETNPAGRNTDVITQALKQGWMTIGDITKIEVTGNFPGDNHYSKHAPTVQLTFGEYDKERVAKAQGQAIANLKKGGATIYQLYRDIEAKAVEANADKDTKLLSVKKPNGDLEPVPIKAGETIAVNQYVYALGATTLAQATGSGGILDETIKIHPVYDEDKRFGDVSNETVIAFTDGDGLWVVGAAVFRAGNEGKKYANVTQMMAKSGHPPEGIAGIVASIAAVTGIHGVYRINFATADFKMLENWVGSVYREMRRRNETTLRYAVLPEAIRRFVADQIVALRKHTTFGAEHLGKKGTDGIILTVKAMLTSPQTLAAWLPKELQARWAPPR